MKKINIIGANHFYNCFRPDEEPYNNPKKHFLLKQTPNQSGIWEDISYYIDSDESIDFDAYVFLDVPDKFRCLQDKPNLLLMAEAFHEEHPNNIIEYHKDFISQFDKVITTNFPIKHKNIVNTQIGFPFFCTAKSNVDYDFLKKTNISPDQKTKKICMICSNHNDVLHNARFQFAKKIKESLGEEIDWYGRGVNRFDNIYDTLKEYEYAIIFENSSNINYFSEKLSDAFLCNTFPIYWGAPNIEDFFDKNSMMTIDINLDNFDLTLNKIKELISSKHIFL